MKIPHCCLISSGSVILVIVISVAWLILPKVIESKIKNKVRLVEGSDTWKAWANVSVPIYLKIYIFNVTNPTEIQEGKKPRVLEMGPYVYLERRTKIDIEITNEDTVRYRQPVTYFFDEEKSNGKETDSITILNTVFIGLIEMGHKLTKDELTLSLLDDMITLKEEKLFQTQIVREILFDGFSVQNFLDLLNDPIVQSFGDVKIPPQFADGKFGLFKGKNGSDEGVMEIQSGVSDVTKFGQIVSWNNMSHLTWWKDTCNMINGTDGTLFQPFLNKESRIYLFASDLCRSMYMSFDSETEFEGVPGYRFSLPDELLQGPETNPENWCFCNNKAVENKTNPECKHNGIVNLSTCKGGSPIIASSPHFYRADDDIISGIDGISPNEEKHKTFLDLEPRTGLLLRAAKRLQFNLLLKRYKYISTFENVQTVVFPLIWVEQGATLSGESLETVQSLTLLFHIVGIVKWLIIGFGVCILGTGVVLASLRKAQIIPN